MISICTLCKIRFETTSRVILTIALLHSRKWQINQNVLFSVVYTKQFNYLNFWMQLLIVLTRSRSCSCMYLDIYSRIYHIARCNFDLYDPHKHQNRYLCFVCLFYVCSVYVYFCFKHRLQHVELLFHCFFF